MKSEEALLLVKQYENAFIDWFSYKRDMEEDPVLTGIYSQFFKNGGSVKRIMWSLGFAQGAAYVLKLFTIERIKEHSQRGYIRPLEPERSEFLGTTEWADEIIVNGISDGREWEQGLNLLKEYGDELRAWFVSNSCNEGDPILTEIYRRFPQKTGSVNKLIRWVGFIQGAAYKLKLFTIEEIENHSRECSIEPFVDWRENKEKQQTELQEQKQELG